jgi:N-sulfoglucosamine sulfohydrolase
LLVLLSDDQSDSDVGCYGNASCVTPNIDALARNGVRFERAYTAVGVCQPSRSSLYTGLYPTKHGALGFGPIASDVATWPELLNAAGVATAMIGKLDVDPPEKFPFEYLVKAKDMPSRRDPAQFERCFREFLASVRERRFAAVIAFHDPHRPFEEEAPERPAVDPKALEVPAFLWDTPDTRLDLARYYDCVARLDRGVGRVLAALADAGHAEDTLVIFTSDNGASFPFAKSTLYEAGVRMPFVAHGPGVRSGVSGEFVSLLDVLPTALELFGLPPRAVDGASLAPLLFEGRALDRGSFVSMQTDNLGGESFPSRALHARRWKYIRNFRSDTAAVTNVVGHTLTWESGKALARTDERVAKRMESYIYRPVEELYDLERDPCELANLAEDASAAAVRDASRDKLRAWMHAHGDPMLASWDA